MSTDRFIEYRVRDGVATVVLDRADRLNAMSVAMAHELHDIVDRIDGDDTVRAAVVTGRGRAFCAGADLEGGGEIFRRDPDEQYDPERHLDYGGVLARRLLAARKPFIAAVNGPAAGIGVSLTLPMDIRLASESARFGFVFTRRGLVPDACSTWFLPRLVGLSRAAEWVYSGRTVSADEALAAGLVRSVHPDGDLLAVAHELAVDLTARSSPVAVAATRRLLWNALGPLSPAQAHDLDSRTIHYLTGLPDVAEGVSSFLEKRDPRFALSVAEDFPPFLEG